MKSQLKIAGALLAIFICGITTTWAETLYVSDQLVVSLREQPQKGSASVTYLKTDMAVEVLEETGDYVKVRTKAGENGYILKKYLTSATPKSIIIKTLKSERDRLADKSGAMQKQVTEAASKNNKSQHDLAAQLEESHKNIENLQAELSKSQADLKSTNNNFEKLKNDAKNVIEITKERDQLREENQELTTSIADLEVEVSNLTKTGAIKWFIAGAIVLLLGWLIGKGSGSRRRRSLL